NEGWRRGRVRTTLGGTAMTTRFAVLGDGAWGTAVALLLAQDADHAVTLWSAREENARILRERRENVRLLPGVPIPPSVALTTDVKQALDGADLGVMAIPTVFVRETMRRIAPHVHQDLPIVSLAKGLESD